MSEAESPRGRREVGARPCLVCARASRSDRVSLAGAFKPRVTPSKRQSSRQRRVNEPGELGFQSSLRDEINSRLKGRP